MAKTRTPNVSRVTLTDNEQNTARSLKPDALEIYARLLRGELEGDEALRASQQMLTMVMDTIPQAVWWKDRNCVFLGVNKTLADRAGLEPEEMIGKTDFDMPWAESDQYGAMWYQEWDREVMESGTPQYGIREELTMPDGSRVWIETSKVPLRSLDGEVVGVLGTFQDVTEQREAEEERQRAMDLLDERVKTRTTALRKANESLRREVEDRIRLQAQERKQRAYAEALRDTAAAVSASLDLDEVLDKVLDGIDRLIPHHLAAVVLKEDDGVHRLAYVHESRRDHSSHTVGEDVHAVRLVTDLARSTEPIIRNDIRSESLGTLSRCAIGAPIAVSDTRIGYLIVEAVSPGFFNQGHIERLTAVADLAAGAITNAQLFSAEAELATLEERQRLARELHDAVSQTLWTANLVSNSISLADDTPATEQQLDRLRTLTRGALAEMRSLLLELRPAALAETPLPELIEQLVDALLSRKSLLATIHVGHDLPEPSPRAKHAFYRIAQEALNNVRRHADATEVAVGLRIEGADLVLSVEDNGVGFAEDQPRGDRLGLSIMRERSVSVEAALLIQSEPGVGTTIEVRLPSDEMT